MSKQPVQELKLPILSALAAAQVWAWQKETAARQYRTDEFDHQRSICSFSILFQIQQNKFKPPGFRVGRMVHLNYRDSKVIEQSVTYIKTYTKDENMNLFLNI